LNRLQFNNPVTIAATPANENKIAPEEEEEEGRFAFPKTYDVIVSPERTAIESMWITRERNAKGETVNAVVILQFFLVGREIFGGIFITQEKFHESRRREKFD
jgi:hypothetical protein